MSTEDVRRALARTESTLQQTLDLTQTGSWEWDVRTNAITWSENLGPIHGLPAGAGPGGYEDFLELIHQDDRAAIEAAVQAALEHGRGYEIELRTSSAEPRWILAQASVVVDASGAPVRIVGLTRDVTERKLRQQRAEHGLRLQQVTAGLAAAATTEEIADVIINEGIPALSASTGVLGVIEETDSLRFVRSVGYADVFPARLKLDDPWPITAAARDRRLIELRDVRERRAHYSVPESVWKASGQGNLIAVPLVTHDRVIGALGFTRDETTPLSDNERQLVETLAHQAAQALERAFLAESERQARARAEALQRVTGAVAKAVTTQDVAEAVASEAQSLLDAASVTIVLRREGGIAEVLASCGDIAGHAMREPRVRLAGGTVTAAVIRSETSIFVESLGELEETWPASAHVASDLRVGAIACIPLRVAEQRGALSVVMREFRPFNGRDRAFLDHLARTCEGGLLRAALFDAEQASRARADILHELAATLSGAVALSDVGSAFLNRATEYLEAGSGSLMLLDHGGSELSAHALAGAGQTRARWLLSLPVDGNYVIASSFRTGQPVWVETRAQLEESYPATAANFGPPVRAACAYPLAVGGKTIGAFGLVFEKEREFSAEDRRLLATMAELCAHAVERARLYEREYQIAHRLQRAMLPDKVARHPAISIAGRYQAGAESMVIGGDWYDTFTFADGRVGLAVGDVVGHGIEAAAAMGRVRSALAAYALDAVGPGDTMRRLHHFVDAIDGVDFATACYSEFDTRASVLRYASAGHPPMLLVTPSGETRWLSDGRTPPLYGAARIEIAEAQVDVEPGSLLLLYSDGLVERRGEHIRDGLDRLEQAVLSLHRLPVEEVCERLIEVVTPSSRPDDVVILAARLFASTPFRLVVSARPEELRRIRRAMREWLAERGVAPSTADDVVLAIGEACANAVEHAYSAHVGEVAVEISGTSTDILVVVEDSGSWKTRPDENPDRGRGSQIMRALASSVEVAKGPRGTTVQMTFVDAAGTS